MVKIHAKCKFKSAVSDIKMTFGQMQSNSKFLEFLKKIMKEVQNIAKAEGVKQYRKND